MTPLWRLIHIILLLYLAVSSVLVFVLKHWQLGPSGFRWIFRSGAPLLMPCFSYGSVCWFWWLPSLLQSLWWHLELRGSIPCAPVSGCMDHVGSTSMRCDWKSFGLGRKRHWGNSHPQRLQVRNPCQTRCWPASWAAAAVQTGRAAVREGSRRSRSPETHITRWFSGNSSNYTSASHIVHVFFWVLNSSILVHTYLRNVSPKLNWDIGARRVPKSLDGEAVRAWGEKKWRLDGVGLLLRIIQTLDHIQTLWFWCHNDWVSLSFPIEWVNCRAEAHAWSVVPVAGRGSSSKRNHFEAKPNRLKERSHELPALDATGINGFVWFFQLKPNPFKGGENLVDLHLESSQKILMLRLQAQIEHRAEISSSEPSGSEARGPWPGSVDRHKNHR